MLPLISADRTEMSSDETLTNGERWFIWRWRQQLSQARAAKHLKTTRDVYARAERSDDASQLGPLVEPRVGVALSRLKANECCVIYRRRCGFSQEEIARAMGVSRATVNAMECGRVDCTDLVNYWEN